MKHDELLNLIKTAIKQLADDKSVPQRQTLRELTEIQEYIRSVVDILNGKIIGDRAMTERDEL